LIFSQLNDIEIFASIAKLKNLLRNVILDYQVFNSLKLHFYISKMVLV
jgi:hypothetical protein